MVRTKRPLRHHPRGRGGHRVASWLRSRLGGRPVLRVTPKDVGILIGRLRVLFDRPSTISPHQGLSATSEISVDALREFVELTRGGQPPTQASPLSAIFAPPG